MSNQNPVCCACNSVVSKVVLKWKKYTIYRCEKCALIFADPLPSESALEKFYQGFMFNKPELYEVKSQLRNRKKEVIRIFGLDEGSKGKLFLDHGGGTGVVSKAAMEIGLEGYYYDLDKDAEQFAIDFMGIERDKIVSNLSQNNLKFDFIFSDNVIEHIPDPIAFVKTLMEELNSGGVLVFKTPHGGNSELLFNPMISIKGYFLEALKYNSVMRSIRAYFLRFWSCDPPRHIYSFTRPSLVALMEKILKENTHTFSYEIGYYRIPTFTNTLTKQFFSRDKRMRGLKSFVVRLAIWPAVLIELLIVCVKELLLISKVISPGGLILKIKKA